MNKLLAAALLVAPCLSACGHSAYMVAAEDPAFAPSKADPISVTLSKDPSIMERQLLPVLKEELCRAGFNITTREASKWILGMSFESFQYGSNVSRGAVRPNYENAIELRLFRTSEVEQSNDAIWSAALFPNNSVFRAYRRIIFRPLLQNLGKNFEGKVKLRKADLRNPGPCPPDAERP